MVSRLAVGFVATVDESSTARMIQVDKDLVRIFDVFEAWTRGGGDSDHKDVAGKKVKFWL